VSECVLIGGVFDPLHAGHLAYIREAQRYGTVVCAVSDAPEKHPPLVPIASRIALLQALGVSPVAHMGDVSDIIREYRPKYYVKGGDWIGKLPEAEVAACKEVGTALLFTDTVWQSSSKLLADYERKRNTEKLVAFESFVQSQKSALKPWEPVTDYSWDARQAIEGPHAQLIVDAFAPQRVLDVGAGPGHLVRMLRDIGVAAVGMDANPGWQSHNVVVGDITNPGIQGVRLGYDAVICREVLEHLTVRQLVVAVRNLVSLSARYVYVTTRFTAKSHLLDVDVADDLDPTHITLLSQDFLRTLFVLEGCTRRPDLEETLDHMKKGRCLAYEVPRG
jgi:cytidyltransferase-like protein